MCWWIIKKVKSKINKMEKTITELKKLASIFKHRKLFTNDSILMQGDLEKLTQLINKLKIK